MSYSEMVREIINQYSEQEIIDTQKIYATKCKNIPEQAYYKTISRMTKSGELERLTKSIYCKPKIGRFGKIVSSDKHILNHYLGSNGTSGVIIGYRMYNKYKLTTQISKMIQVYSNVSEQEKKKVMNVEIRKANVRFDSASIKMVELLDFLENIYNIEDLNKENAILFIEKAIESYSERILEKLIKNIGYKKSTLASLKNVLDYYNVSHTVGKHLNDLSTYKSVRMEDLYELAL